MDSYLTAHGIANVTLGEMGDEPDGCVALYEDRGNAPAKRAFSGVQWECARLVVQVRDATYPLAIERARAVYDLLAAVTNELIEGVFYRTVEPLTPPYSIGYDERGRLVLEFECDVEKAPSPTT